MVRRSTASLIVLLAIQIVVVVGFQWNERVLMETSAHLSVPPGWDDLGRAVPDQALELSIAIKHQRVAEFEHHLMQVSTPRSGRYGQHWTLKQVSEFLAPHPSASPIIHSWLKQNQIFTIQEIGNDWIRAVVSVEQAEQLLSITIHKFQHQETGLTLFRTLDHYSVPRIVAQHIDLIGGLIRFPKMPRNLDHQRLVGETTPASIQKMYDITVPAENPDNLQAVASFLNQYFSPSDLATFEQQNSLPNVPIARIIGPNYANLPGVEASLDVQFLLGTPDCSIETWVISTSGRTSTGNEPFLDFLVNLQANTNGTVPKLISMSYQDYEYTVSEEYANRCNEEFMKYSMNGTTFITGSGDWGVGCVDSDHCSYFTADFPSSSPYVISTGATTLSTNGQEIGVSFSSGGFSNYFAQPPFQAQAVSAFLNQSSLPPSNLYNASGRAFPDVAAIGTGFQVVYRGQVKPVGGTSASTPTFGSILSMINSQRLANGLPLLGYALPFLYDAWAQEPTAYQDITDSQPQDQGCCGAAFTTVPGWDPYTGLGTPNYSVLLQLALDSTLFA